MSEGTLGNFLREVSNWDWRQFVEAEHDKTYTSNQAMIFALIRSCVMQKMEAIRISLNRIDGKLKTPIKVEYPKVYYLYPHAQSNTGSDVPAKVDPPAGAKTQGGEVDDKSTPVLSGEVLPPAIIEPQPEKDLPSMSLRETLAEMAGYPRELPEKLAELAEQVHRAVQGHNEMPDEIPKVKSVVAAHLLIMAQKRDINALTEVFDQIDGKLAETLQIVGEDIYITSYALTAPADAYLNADGVLQTEAASIENTWAEKLGREVIQ